MDHAAIKPESDDGGNAGAEELRQAPRFTLLIRPAKLVSAQGEFVCVIRDVSASGVSVKLFHSLPGDQFLDLELQSGESYQMAPVWERDGEAGFEFSHSVDVQRLVSEVGEFPKRGLRLGIHMPVTLSTVTRRVPTVIENISQQGARFECETQLAMDQNLRIEGRGLGEVYAKVRWRRDRQYGVVFDDVLTLREFALLAAQLQAPSLILADGKAEFR